MGRLTTALIVVGSRSEVAGFSHAIAEESRTSDLARALPYWHYLHKGLEICYTRRYGICNRIRIGCADALPSTVVVRATHAIRADRADRAIVQSVQFIPRATQ